MFLQGILVEGLPFDRCFILDDPDGHVGVASTSQVQPAVSSFEAVPTGLPKHWFDEDGRELKVGSVLATCEDSSGKPVAAVIGNFGNSLGSSTATARSALL